MDRRDRNRGGKSGGVCRDFQRRGRCKFGDKCKFSHTATADDDVQQTAPKSYRAPDDRDFIGYFEDGNGNDSAADDDDSDSAVAKLREWRQLLNNGKQDENLNAFDLPSDSSPARKGDLPKYANVSRFFSLGLELADGDVSALQEMIPLLVTDNGLNFIKAAVDYHFQGATTQEAKIDLLTQQILPFLRVITHTRLTASNLLEAEVAIIYNFLVGVDCCRVIKLSTFILDLAATWEKLPVGNLDLMSVVEVFLLSLTKAIDCSTTNNASTGFQNVVGRFSRLMEASIGNGSDFWRTQAVKHLHYLQRRLEVLTNTTTKPSAPAQKLASSLGPNLPGNLCENGPRHDNDHEDISMIRILPTSEELDATRAEYLPTNKSSEWHIPGIRGRLDREFRLLREDTVGQLRNEVRRVRQLIRSSGNKGGPTSTFRYGDAAVEDVSFEKLDGLEITLRCKQPANVQHMGDAAREQWWETCKRLQSGHLVCVLDPSIGSGRVQFFVVSDATVRSKTRGVVERTDHRAKGRRGNHEEDDDVNLLRLAYSREFLYVKLNLIESSPDDVALALQWLQGNGSSRQQYLIEFPGVLLASFIHTLKALQHLSQKSDLPFTELIAPEQAIPGGEAHISPPLFSQAPDFTYDLSCLALDKQPFIVELGRLPDPGEVSSRTGLDLTQSEALLSTLSRELSLIQGPPGTGKSYTGEKIIQVLLANKAKAELGPIICVCYTNHALDQLLEHLLENGVKNIIRIGGQSKSERVQERNLTTLVRSYKKTTMEKGYAAEAMNGMTLSAAEMNSKLENLAKCESTECIMAYLRSSHLARYKELFPAHDKVDGEVGEQEHAVILRWLQGGKKSTAFRSLPTLQTVKLGNMTQQERRSVFNSWLTSIRDPIVADILEIQASYNRSKDLHELIRREVRHRCLEGADVVGMTTSGGARELSLLRKLSSKVLLCEEAGEVLESHILTSLLPSVQHAILIGDHQQLRPQINNFDLQSTNPEGAKYSLDMSLFERLVQPPHSSDHKLPFSTLLTQRRMHPDIAQMVRSTLYNKLQDGDNVKEYPQVVGMGRRLFWFNHGHHEDRSGSDSTSRSNQFEVEMAAHLVSHIVKQGEYRPQDIAVLTPYSGQLQKLRYRLEKESSFTVDIVERDAELGSGDATEPERQLVKKQSLFESLRLATVDNFQGEEAKIIIISLVRSNRERVCGFLKTSNRINVLLSRAKHGCYIIGDAQTYGPVPMWSQVIQLLKAGGNFGNALQLKCPRHPGTAISVNDPTDFATSSPDGGCDAPCGRPLDCGHDCYGACHSEMLHKTTFCHQKCKRTKQGCEHICQEECGVDCENECNVFLENVFLALPCGHTKQSATCSETQRPATVKCEQEVARTMPNCGHIALLPCHVDVTEIKMICEAPCGEMLKCSHACQLPCHRCLKPLKDSTLYVRKCSGTCQSECGRRRAGCSHPCTRPCHRSECGPCVERCEVACSHSHCPKLCHETCVPCTEDKCASHCPHSQCSMPCAVACDHVPCSRRCESRLLCGHQCPSVCGEACPDAKFCQQCGSEDILSTIVEYTKMREYKTIDLNRDPCIFAACGHVLTRSYMDAYMAVSNATCYNLDNSYSPVSTKGPLKPFSMDSVEAKACPQCNGPLRNISRYGRIVRAALLDDSTKQLIMWSEGRHLQLAARLLQEEQSLLNDHNSVQKVVYDAVKADNVLNQLSSINALSGTNRYDSMIKTYVDLSEYHDQIRAEEQPYYKIANSVTRVYELKRANWPKSAGRFIFDASIIRPRGYLLATALLLKCSIVILLDIMKNWPNDKNDSPDASFLVTQCNAQCQELISLAQQTGRTQLEAEGHVYAATLSALRSSDPGSSDRYDTHVRQARTLLLAGKKWGPPVKTIIDAGIRAAEAVFKGNKPGPFVSVADSRAVYDGMAWDFPGGIGGTWFVCARGHPFTIGFSSGTQPKCPECGAPVGDPGRPAALEWKHVTMGEDLAAQVGEMKL